MRARTLVLLAVLLVTACAPKRRPTPTTEEARACVDYCEESISPCKSSCLWWAALAWPVIFFCQGDCDRDYDRCEMACPGMTYTRVSATR